MSRLRSVGDLITDARQRADQENSTLRFPDTEVLEYVNQSIADLYDQLVRAKGADFFAIDGTPQAGNGVTTAFALPADFYTLVSVRLDLGGGRQIGLEKFTEVEEPMLLSVPAGGSATVQKYRIRGGGSSTQPDKLEILPPPPVGTNVLTKYLPIAVRLDPNAPNPNFDGYNGWEEFVVLDAARKIATKDQRWDLVASLRVDIAKIESRIAALAGKRDRGKPDRVQDTRSARSWGRRQRWGLG